MTSQKASRPRVLLASLVPPRNDCGVRIVMFRHLVERKPFQLHVASNADFAVDLLIHTRLRLPWAIQKLKRSRWGRKLSRWILDFENFVWPFMGCSALDRTVQSFKPDVILTLAEPSVAELARRAARRFGIPLAGLFLDWFPVMEGHYGTPVTRNLLSARYRRLYAACDLVFCTSDGMQEELGWHRNSHVVYPMPGRHSLPARAWPPHRERFRVVYVGNAQGFYGRMLQALLKAMESSPELELIVVGPNDDWPQELRQRGSADDRCVGAKPPDEAAEFVAGADALLVVMSFEEKHKLFMRTSFTTKLLDYSAHGKPIILWGPEYCSPARVVNREGGAALVVEPDPGKVVEALKRLRGSEEERVRLSVQSNRLWTSVFCPDRLQSIFVNEIHELSSRNPRRT